MVIIGCLFHWKQANRRRLIALKFAENVIGRLMRPGILGILTVIPPTEICSIGFEFIRAKLNLSNAADCQKLDVFFTYFRATWMTSFCPSDWNIYAHIDNLQIVNRTNNPLERHNRHLNGLFTNAHPNSLDFVERLRKDCEECFQ